MNRSPLLLSLLLLLGGPPSASAATGSDPDGARRLFNEAEASRVARDFKTCVAKAEQAYAAYAHVQILSIQGLCEYELGRYPDAARHLSAYVEDASSEVPPEVRATYEKSLARVALVEIVSSPAGAAIEVDGGAAVQAPTKVFLLPGEHRFRATAPGHDPKGETKTLPAGVRIKITLDLAVTGAAAPPASTGSTSAGGGTDEDREGIPAWPGAVLVGAGAVGVGLGIGLFAGSLGPASDADDVAETCGTDERCRAKAQPLLDDRDTLRTGSFIGFAAGGAFAVAGAIYFIVRASGDEESAIQLTPVLSPQLAGAALFTSF